MAREPGTAAEVYFYDSEDRLQTRRGSTIVETVLHGPGIDDYIGARDSGGVVRYMLTDGLGSVTERTTRAGSLTWRAEYDPFGAATAVYDPGGIGAGGYGYTGRVNDAATGLMYYRSRYYSPEMRRFTQEDRWSGVMYNPDTYINGYVYIQNRPINGTDPLGFHKGSGLHMPLAVNLCPTFEPYFDLDQDGNLEDAAGNEWIQDPCSLPYANAIANKDTNYYRRVDPFNPWEAVPPIVEGS